MTARIIVLDANGFVGQDHTIHPTSSRMAASVDEAGFRIAPLPH
jgi:hypothetical protein